LQARHLPAAICPQAGPSRLGRSVHRTTVVGTGADQTVRLTLSSAGRKGTTPHRLRTLQADSGAAGVGEDLELNDGIVVPHVGKTSQRL
jgi:hypothetical protein